MHQNLKINSLVMLIISCNCMKYKNYSSKLGHACNLWSGCVCWLVFTQQQCKESLLQSLFGTSSFLTHTVTGPACEVMSCTGCNAISDWLTASLIGAHGAEMYVNTQTSTFIHTVWWRSWVKVTADCAASTIIYVRLYNIRQKITINNILTSLLTHKIKKPWC